MANPVVHFEVIGKDGAEAPGVLRGSVRLDDRREQPDELRHGRGSGNGVGGGIGAGPEGYGGHVTFYVEVPDVEAALAKAESLGGKRVMGPETIMENVTLGQFTDPEGHVIGLTQSAAVGRPRFVSDTAGVRHLFCCEAGGRRPLRRSSPNAYSHPSCHANGSSTSCSSGTRRIL